MSIFQPSVSGSIKEPARLTYIKILISVNGDRGPDRGFFIFRQVKAFDSEDDLCMETIHNGLHRSDGNALIGDRQHFIGFF